MYTQKSLMKIKSKMKKYAVLLLQRTKKIVCGKIRCILCLFSENFELYFQQLVKKLSLKYTRQNDTLLPNTISRNYIHLNNRHIEEKGHLVAQLIRHWPNEQPLLELCLKECSMSKAAWDDVLQSLSSCKYLTHLDLSWSFINKTELSLGEAITFCGDNPSLQKLQLFNCSLQVDASLEFVQSLSMCGKFIELDLGRNNLGEAGHKLAQSIKSWGDEPPLQGLWLSNCSLTATAALELVESSSVCKKLTSLDLRENMIGECGHQLAQSIRS